MITLNRKISIKWAIRTLCCFVLLTGCSSLSDSSTSRDTQNIAKTENNSTNGTQDSVIQVTPIAHTKGELVTSDQKPSTDTEVISLQAYFDLLGSSKQDLINSTSEKPVSTDEGGLEFKETGIRVWFTDRDIVSQIFTQRNDLDFKGAKIGDKIEKFKTAFGEAVSDKNGDMHFKYENGFISVNYDTQTDITYAVYLLSENF